MTKNDSVDISEFESLRQEIINRTTLAYTLIPLQLTALGAGISFSGRTHHIFAGLSITSSLLWLFWLEHTGQIFRIGAYISIELRPRFTESYGRNALGWESFWRRIDPETGTDARQPKKRRSLLAQPGPADWYVALLFGGVTPLLLAIYFWSSALDPHGMTIWVWLASASAIAFWLFSLSRFLHYVRTVKNLTAMINAHVDHEQSAPTGRSSG
jgi:hypothetical protein